MHTSGGHTNHYWKEILNALKAKMKGCAWQVWLASIELEVTINLGEVDTKIKSGESGVESKEIKKQLRRVRTKWRTTTDPQEKATLFAEDESTFEELKDIAATSRIWDYNLIHADTKDFQQFLKA